MNEWGDSIRYVYIGHVGLKLNGMCDIKNIGRTHSICALTNHVFSNSD